MISLDVELNHFTLLLNRLPSDGVAFFSDPVQRTGFPCSEINPQILSIDNNMRQTTLRSGNTGLSKKIIREILVESRSVLVVII